VSAEIWYYTVCMHQALSETAALLSDPGRAAILTALMNGTALPAGQLAMIANVTPQTASSHLSKLVDGELLKVEQQGRHRYYRLAHMEVAHLIEALVAVTPKPKPRRDEAVQPGTFEYARTCYSHLAGRFAVRIADALQRRELLALREPKRFVITGRGREWFTQLGIAIGEKQMKDAQFARPCLDCTERRYHLAGPLGSAMLARFRELQWIASIASVAHTRAVRVTLQGEQKLSELLGLNGRMR